jgi:septal ring factor EnvC (AmiA/AmiB activator)
MPIFTEDEKKAGTSEDFLDLINNQRKSEGDGDGGKIKSLLRKIPVATIILLILILVLGGLVISLESRLSSLAGDVDEMRKLKTQLAAVESKVEASRAETQKLKADLAQTKSEVDAMKAQREKAEAERIRQQELAKKKPAAAPKKPAPVPPRPKKPQAF